MTNFLSILGALLLLTVFVAVHELGHYTAGRLLGFGILEYAIGMGPVVLKKEKNGIQYSLRALPLGGMCRFYGEDEALPAGASGMIPFNAQKLWKRAVVVASGPVMNILLAVVFAALSLGIFGDFMAQVQEFSYENSPAQQAGMEVGDMIYAVEGERLLSYSEAVPAIRAADSGEMDVTVLRDGKKLRLTLHDIYDAEAGYNRIGVNIGAARRTYGLFEAVGDSFGYVWAVVREMFQALGRMVTSGVQEGDVMGPVGTITIMSEFVRYGWETMLRMALLVSANLGILNLLPIPGLDGGRLAFMAVEGLRGKPVPPEKEGMVHFIG
ncbi:MAG: PDZ domain-containing protein, partial [Clostridia bacterium]|nr:PDZ domain-containing protein [Clostridia bacterium]